MKHTYAAIGSRSVLNTVRSISFETFCLYVSLSLQSLRRSLSVRGGLCRSTVVFEKARLPSERLQTARKSISESIACYTRNRPSTTWSFSSHQPPDSFLEIPKTIIFFHSKQLIQDALKNFLKWLHALGYPQSSRNIVRPYFADSSDTTATAPDAPRPGRFMTEWCQRTHHNRRTRQLQQPCKLRR